MNSFVSAVQKKNTRQHQKGNFTRCGGASTLIITQQSDILQRLVQQVGNIDQTSGKVEVRV